jgi:hypothetical protein
MNRVLLILIAIAILSCLLMMMIGNCPNEPAFSPDAPPSSGLHVVLQMPFHAHCAARQREYHKALLATLDHPHVSVVHVLAESVAHQLAMPEHPKLQTYNIAHRITYADAVRYANLYLINATTLICMADVSVSGAHWDLLTPDTLAGHMYGLTRHEQAGCADQCDCIRNWGGCYDGFVFVPPLLGGEELLERISFRMGGLWGSENRFMWEVHLSNPQLRISNPCRTFRLIHWHCIGGGRYRPTQDERRINGEGRSLEPFPTRWHPRE